MTAGESSTFWGASPSKFVEDTMQECIQQFPAKPPQVRHLYEIHISPRAPAFQLFLMVLGGLVFLSLTARPIILQDFLMTPKTIATLLILLACATTGANLAAAPDAAVLEAAYSHGGGGGDFHGGAPRERLPRTRSSRTKLRWVRDRGPSRPREVRRLLAHFGA